ncbi:MAG: KH domain-containing protein [Myxococcales bacterium]|nr:KH domain-containing protein [Myxococcales bacterium]
MDQLAELIDYVARALVDDPEEVTVEAVEGDRAIILELTVAPSDLGKVIGKDGRTARAMRTLLSATSARMRRRAILDILE